MNIILPSPDEYHGFKLFARYATPVDEIRKAGGLCRVKLVLGDGSTVDTNTKDYAREVKNRCADQVLGVWIKKKH